LEYHLFTLPGTGDKPDILGVFVRTELMVAQLRLQVLVLLLPVQRQAPERVQVRVLVQVQVLQPQVLQENLQVL